MNVTWSEWQIPTVPALWLPSTKSIKVICKFSIADLLRNQDTYTIIENKCGFAMISLPVLVIQLFPINYTHHKKSLIPL